MDYRFLLPAEEEITEPAAFNEKESKGLGTDFLDEIENAISMICENPEVAQIYSSEMRGFVLARFPYSLIYVVEKENILIVAVAHHRREPRYWKNR
jgi:plasmid stabilization system protein ParE